MDAWRLGLKSRLRAVVQGEGSQRKLAKRWLGNADAASQVSEWCSPTRETVPGAENLHRLRAECGTDLNWLLCGPETPGEESGEWPAARRAGLARELQSFAAEVVTARVGAKRLPQSKLAGVPAYLLAASWVVNAVRNDFLRFFVGELERVVDEECERVQRAADQRDAERHRREWPSKLPKLTQKRLAVRSKRR